MIDRFKPMNNEHNRNRGYQKNYALLVIEKKKQQEKNADDSEIHHYHYQFYYYYEKKQRQISRIYFCINIYIHIDIT